MLFVSLINMLGQIKGNGMNNTRAIKWYLLICFFACSCSPIYFPNVINTPLFTEKGQISAAANFSFLGSLNIELNSFDLQSAMAATDNVAVMYNYSYGKMGRSADHDFHEHKYQETGVGYYRTFFSKYNFESFVGYGRGCSETRNVGSADHRDREIKGDYDRWFFYPTIGFSMDLKGENRFDPERVEGGITTRVCNLKWRNVEHNLKGTVLKENWYIEPAIFVRAGWEHFLFQFQSGQIYALFKDDLVESSDGWLSFGIIFNLDLY